MQKCKWSQAYYIKLTAEFIRWTRLSDHEWLWLLSITLFPYFFRLGSALPVRRRAVQRALSRHRRADMFRRAKTRSIAGLAKRTNAAGGHHRVCSEPGRCKTWVNFIIYFEKKVWILTLFLFVHFQAFGALCEDSGIRPHWLLWLTIALAVLFLIMLLMNIFLCTAMSCSCARTEVIFSANLQNHQSFFLPCLPFQIIEKEPSIIEEYDPYRSWHGSQYGSRYSLHGRDGGQNKGYTSGGSTIHSNRSLPIDSDHYAIVHSRPGSRHSGLHGHRPRGPPSNM